ncbi:hypothetical protein [Shinella oryzae]|uniref:hypothetical protein n=1 Tax=Shinella oryzae TaxID=2871820 RepID=UPI001FF2F112|nr:hypothetical protein [Shinella oryzae]UPA26856.1 hypothetical protein K6301_23320 [Shinella oryzae]
MALHIPGREQAVFAHSSQEVERLLSRADLADMRSKAVEELRSQQAVWDMKGWELGYNQACEEEVKADRMEWELAETLWSISAGSLLGVVAKIDCVIEMTGPDVFLQEIPAKVLRLVLSDLKRMISVSPEPYRPKLPFMDDAALKIVRPRAGLATPQSGDASAQTASNTDW